ncbi:hypothetical protein V2J92_07280 [Pseudomonas alliivorans]|uniref:hypothetical protein n=1 Tax=Pseudomonas alliivorans TaxID=2810613 RepID=UPI001AE0F8F6|nr:hypothetical protein [Pseudomonas alliivorans]MBP0943148.1 hypothetical protein [Pseudomonas alliivorans]MBP0948878.1 hypothetical protein [Pseudomonas alliivorans]MEE4683579.1 hypothetical protein [Pseudomonas alliivorans]MEE4742257.1 hypothetical protein [Pseudomonas alliivorans]MEE4881243.1 hypothetical protein [Pseudomonas alliivorans]
MLHSLPQASLIQAQTRNRRPGARTFIITRWARQRGEYAAVLPATAFEQSVHVDADAASRVFCN